MIPCRKIDNAEGGVITDIEVRCMLNIGQELQVDSLVYIVDSPSSFCAAKTKSIKVSSPSLHKEGPACFSMTRGRGVEP